MTQDDLIADYSCAHGVSMQRAEAVFTRVQQAGFTSGDELVSYVAAATDGGRLTPPYVLDILHGILEVSRSPRGYEACVRVLPATPPTGHTGPLPH